MPWAPTSSGNVPGSAVVLARRRARPPGVPPPRAEATRARIRSNNSPDLRLIADVGRDGVNPTPVALRDVVDRPLCVRIGHAPAGQHDVTGPQLGQMGRRVQAECTEAAGDQIAPVAARL